jgi:hypothetical protein
MAIESRWEGSLSLRPILRYKDHPPNFNGERGCHHRAYPAREWTPDFRFAQLVVRSPGTLPSADTFHCRPVTDWMVRSIGIRGAGRRSSDPSPPIRRPAGIEPRSPVRMPSLHALHGCGEPESGVNLF